MRAISHYAAGLAAALALAGCGGHDPAVPNASADENAALGNAEAMAEDTSADSLSITDNAPIESESASNGN